MFANIWVHVWSKGLLWFGITPLYFPLSEVKLSGSTFPVYLTSLKQCYDLPCARESGNLPKLKRHHMKSQQATQKTQTNQKETKPCISQDTVSFSKCSCFHFACITRENKYDTKHAGYYKYSSYKCWISVKVVNFSVRVTLKSDWWSWKTKWHIFYATSNYVHHFIAIGEFKLELQSGNARLTDGLEKQ